MSDSWESAESGWFAQVWTRGVGATPSVRNMDRPPSPPQGTSDELQSRGGALDVAMKPPELLPATMDAQVPPWQPTLPMPAVAWMGNVHPSASAACWEAAVGQETGTAASSEVRREGSISHHVQQEGDDVGIFQSDRLQRQTSPPAAGAQQEPSGTLGSGEGPCHPSLPSHDGEAAGVKPVQNYYQAVPSHWFYCKEEEAKPVWTPFSKMDSDTLETRHCSGKDWCPGRHPACQSPASVGERCRNLETE
ncbi:uncharacterized protein LOC119957287 [Scyliorhinus canicula]|uniref:uncharacterized protein LOC119957287 n=1 Tax=Scyliorhinus canicula TaxID=7830 RepID=UPI0018F5BDA2|nr:uncharacterized protein LOC119957287 [Scyliorhinus canicula]